MKVLLYISLAVFSITALAKTERPPLPAEIQAAKTIYLDNESALAIVADYAYRELKKWNRFEIVDSPDNADLVFVFKATDDRSASRGTVDGEPVALYGGKCSATLDVRSNKNKLQSLWQDTKPCSRHGASADLIRELRRRMEDR